MDARLQLRLLVSLGIAAGALLQLLVETPGELLQVIADQASHGHLRLLAPEGGLLSGRAGMEWTRASGMPLALGRWSWTLAWSTPIGPAWRVDVDSGPLAGSLSVHPGAGRLALADVRVGLPAQAVPAGYAGWDLLHAGGRLELESAQLEADAIGLQGDGVLRWRDATTSLTPVAPLGSWSAHWEARGKEGRFRLETLAGPLHLEGEGRFGLDGRLGLNGRAWSDASHAQALEPVLAAFGNRREDGSVGLALPWPPAP